MSKAGGIGLAEAIFNEGLKAVVAGVNMLLPGVLVMAAAVLMVIVNRCAPVASSISAM